jgi:hypothetical protein
LRVLAKENFALCILRLLAHSAPRGESGPLRVVYELELKKTVTYSPIDDALITVPGPPAREETVIADQNRPSDYQGGDQAWRSLRRP